MKVSDIMTGDVRACRPENNLAEAARVMWERDCGSVPVVDTSNRVVGMVTDRDICMAVATQNRLASEIRAGEIGLRQVITCSPEADVAAALALMQREQVRRLPVVDAQGALVGILSLHDVT
ncbi:MAG: CBS domain-containing protein, partial [Pyrinomonadaceae bacterium]